MSRRCIPQPIRLANIWFDPARDEEIALVTASWTPPHKAEYELRVNLRTLACSCECTGFCAVMAQRARYEHHTRPSLTVDAHCCQHLRAARHALIEWGYLPTGRTVQIDNLTTADFDRMPEPGFPDEDDDLHDAPTYFKPRMAAAAPAHVYAGPIVDYVEMFS